MSIIDDFATEKLKNGLICSFFIEYFWIWLLLSIGLSSEKGSFFFWKSFLTKSCKIVFEIVQVLDNVVYLLIILISEILEILWDFICIHDRNQLTESSLNICCLNDQRPTLTSCLCNIMSLIKDDYTVGYHVLVWWE